MFRSGMLLVLCATLGLAACGDKLAMKQYEQLKVGQGYDEVVGIIGNPASCNEMVGIRSCVWGTDQKNIKVTFAGGKVFTLSATNLK